MHRPFGILGIRGDVHDDFPKTAPDAALFDGSTEAIKSIAVSELNFLGQ